MIIIEGPDGSGKSSLISMLGHTAVHLKSLRGGIGGATPRGWATSLDVVDSYRAKLDEAAEQGGVTAFDRFHLSEWVYGPILRQTQLITDDVMERLTLTLRRRQVPVILCLPPFKVTLANVGLPGRERPSYQTEGFLRQAYKGFEAVAPWATVIFDYTRDPLPVVASQV